ncbi:MAG: tetratricopeptide repeat protein, partial [Deltaproteobacteria bacterium]|nr:tetratricopeptide repeat protein [Deltaproteobacteria bacterium]
LIQAATQMKDLKQIETFLNHCATVHGVALAHLALGRVLADRDQAEKALECYNQALALDPLLTAAHLEKGKLVLSLGRQEAVSEAYQMLLDKLKLTETAYNCLHCGLESRELMWRCPRCYHWDAMTLKESPCLTSSAKDQAVDEPPFPVKETTVDS